MELVFMIQRAQLSSAERSRRCYLIMDTPGRTARTTPRSDFSKVVTAIEASGTAPYAERICMRRRFRIFSISRWITCSEAGDDRLFQAAGIPNLQWFARRGRVSARGPSQTPECAAGHHRQTREKHVAEVMNVDRRVKAAIV